MDKVIVGGEQSVESNKVINTAVVVYQQGVVQAVIWEKEDLDELPFLESTVSNCHSE